MYAFNFIRLCQIVLQNGFTDLYTNSIWEFQMCHILTDSNIVFLNFR